VQKDVSIITFLPLETSFFEEISIKNGVRSKYLTMKGNRRLGVPAL